MSALERRPWWAVAGLMTLFLALQVRGITAPDAHFYDEGLYWQTARLLLRGEPLYASLFCGQPPGFIEVSALALHLLGDSARSGRAAMALLSSLLIPALFVLGRQLGTVRLGLVLALLATLNSKFWYLGHHFMGDGAAVALFAWSAVLCLAALNQTKPGRARLLAAAAGIVCELSLEMKPIMAPGIGLLLVFFVLRPASAAVFVTALGATVLVHLAASGWFAAGGFAQLQSGALVSAEPAANHTAAEKVLYFLASANYDRPGNPLWPLLTLAALPLAARASRPAAVWLACYLVVFALALAVHRNVNWNHYVVFVPATVVLVGLALSATRRRLFPALCVVALLADCVVIATTTWRPPADLPPRTAVLDQIARRTSPDAVILSDDPFTVARSGRLSPPWFVDTTYTRIRFGGLTCNALRPVLDDPRVESVIIGGRLRALDCGTAFVDEVRRRFPIQFPAGGESRGYVAFFRARPAG